MSNLDHNIAYSKQLYIPYPEGIAKQTLANYVGSSLKGFHCLLVEHPNIHMLTLKFFFFWFLKFIVIFPRKKWDFFPSDKVD